MGDRDQIKDHTRRILDDFEALSDQELNDYIIALSDGREPLDSDEGSTWTRT